MSKEELRAQLDAAGIEYDKRFGEKKLAALLPQVPEYSEEEIKNIERAVSKEDEKPLEVVLAEQTSKIMGEVVTPSGIVVPAKVIAGLQKSIWHYEVSHGQDRSLVVRYHKKYSEDVRVYSRDIHGERFKELAEQFVRKNNNK